MKSILKNKNFALICSGIMISTIGDNLYNLALTISIYKLTGTIAAVAGAWLVRAAIRIPSQFISGIIADKYNRKKVIISAQIFCAIIAFMFIFVTEKNLILAYILIFLLQAIADVDDTAGNAFLPEVVDKTQLSEANSVFTLTSTVALLLSPALAGVIYVKYGASILYIMNSASFLISALIFLFIKYNYTKIESDEKHKFTLFTFARNGFRKVLGNKIIYISILVMMNFSLLGRFYDIYKVYVADKILNIGAEGIIYFSYAMAFGSLLTPLCIRFAKQKNIEINTSYLAVSLFSGISYLFWGVVDNFYLSCASLFLMGIFTSAMSVYITTIIQQQVEKEHVGRVFSFYKISIMFSAIFGIVIAPILFNKIGVKFAVGIFSIISIVLVSLFGKLQHRNYKEVVQNIE